MASVIAGHRKHSISITSYYQLLLIILILYEMPSDSSLSVAVDGLCSNFILNDLVLYYFIAYTTLKQKKYKFKLKILKQVGLHGIYVCYNGGGVNLNLQIRADDRSINKTVINKYVNLSTTKRRFAQVQHIPIIFYVQLGMVKPQQVKLIEICGERLKE